MYPNTPNDLEHDSLSVDAPLRPLLIAEAANPEWTSVPLVGWSLARAISRRTSSLIVTQIRNREAFIRAGLQPGKDFVTVDNEHVAKKLFWLGERIRGGDNKGWTMVTALSSLAYYSFEREVWRLLGDRLKAGEFDLVHRITPLSPTSQSPIVHRLEKLGVPFVIGPLNGGVPWPAGFSDVQVREREWLSSVRKLYRLMPSFQATRTKAAAIIAGSRHTLGELPASCVDRSFFIPENAVEPERFPFTVRKLDGDRFRIAFIGRLVPYKGADMLIEAVAAYRGKPEIDLLIIGDGPQRPELEQAVRRHGLERHVRLAGWVPHAELSTVLRDFHVMALPSVREFGGGVVLEAMALGLVPVVANYGGPPELLDERSGIAVNFSNRASLVAGFTAALEALAADPARLEAMSGAAAERVQEHFTWDAKAKQIDAIYDWILRRGPRPDV